MSLRFRVAPFAAAIVRALPKKRGFRSMILHHVENPAAFERTLDGVGSFITPDEAAAILRGKEAAGQAWLVTFDDGFASNLDTARTLLAPRNIKAVFFVCPGLIDASADEQQQFIRQYVFDGAVPPHEHPRFLTWDEVRELRAMGHTIGSHSMMHRRLSALPAGEIEKDVAMSKKRIREELGEDANWFAYPFGDLASISADALAIIGRHFEFCVSGVRGVNDRATHRAAILRDAVDYNTPRSYQRLVLDGGLDLLYRSQRRALAAMASQRT